MGIAPLLAELRAGKFYFSGSASGPYANGHDISYRTPSGVLINFKGGVFFTYITLQFASKYTKYGPYSAPEIPRKLYQKQIYEAMKEGAKHHAIL